MARWQLYSCVTDDKYWSEREGLKQTRHHTITSMKHGKREGTDHATHEIPLCTTACPTTCATRNPRVIVPFASGKLHRTSSWSVVSLHQWHRRTTPPRPAQHRRPGGFRTPPLT